MTTKTFLFDLNGTMIDDMSYHIHAWHRIFTNLGADISVEKAKLECYGKNPEVLERVFPNRFSEEEKNRMGFEKEIKYQADFRPHLKLIDGLGEFLQKSHNKGIKMGIGSAAIMSNIDFVVDGLDIRHYFESIVSADNVTISKPHPETFLKGAAELNVPPSQCIVFEDSPKGVEAAAKAGMKSIVLTTMHKAEEFEGFDNVLFCAADYTNSQFQEVLEEVVATGIK